jgi:hypothetical protein
MNMNEYSNFSNILILIKYIRLYLLNINILCFFFIFFSKKEIIFLVFRFKKNIGAETGFEPVTPRL